MTTVDLPARLAARPFDERRQLPIPYVSEYDDGVDFVTLNGARVLDCARRHLCSACGQPHEYRLAFVGGPGGFLQRRYTDAPMHLEFISTAFAWSSPRLDSVRALRMIRQRQG